MVYFDGSCALCTASRSWVEQRDPGHRIRFVDFNDQADADLPLPRHRLETEITAVTRNGSITTGYEAWLAILATLPRWRFAVPVLGLATARWIGRRLYRWLAANRHRLGAGSSTRCTMEEPCERCTTPSATTRRPPT